MKPKKQRKEYSMNEPTSTQSTLDGIFTAVVIVTVIILVLLLWSPVSYYLGKWSEYWTTPTDNATIGTSSVTNDVWDRANMAHDKCVQRSAVYFGVPPIQIIAYASSTNDLKYNSYDCYGIVYTKIP